MLVVPEEQYDKIYKYCCLKIKNAEKAEDITQETFLRYLENPSYHSENESIKLLYTIARNLCTDEYRKIQPDMLPEDLPDNTDSESSWTNHIVLKDALHLLSAMDRELVLLRYVNEVPLGVMSELYNISRFALSRRLKKILSELRKSFGKESGI